MEEPVKALISIITYKRPKGLKKLLQLLQEQKVNPYTYAEILIVDNDCTGENPKVISKFESNLSFKFILIEAKEKGIVSARNRAVEYFLQTHFDCLIFIDDDEWPCETNWLQTLIDTQKLTKADIVTSKVYVLAENKSLKWVEKVLEYGTHLKKELGPTNKFYTNNLLIMRSVLQSIQPAFDIRFAFTGSSDLHFCIRCMRSGFKAIFTPHAPVKEIYPISRSNLKWFFLRGYRAGDGATRATLYEEGQVIRTYLKCLAMSGLRLVRGIFFSLLGVITFDKAIIARGFMQVGSGLGTLGGLFGLSYEEYKTIHGT